MATEKLSILGFLFMLCLQAISQTTEIVTNGVSDFFRLKVASEDSSVVFCHMEFSPSYFDWKAPEEEVIAGLWIAKLFSRYRLSVSSKDENGLQKIVNPVEFPDYPTSSFSIMGIAYTNFHIRITPFAMRVPASSNALNCIKLSFYSKTNDTANYVYSVYVNLNTGEGRLFLTNGMLVWQPPESFLPLLPSEDANKQKVFLELYDDRFPKRSPLQPDKEIEVHTDL